MIVYWISCVKSCLYSFYAYNIYWKEKGGEVVLNTPWDNSILFFLLLIRGDKTTDEMNPKIPQSSFADKQV